MAEITKKYEGPLNRIKTETNAEVEKMKENKGDGGAELALNIDGVWETRRQDFSMSVPEVVMKDQKMSMDFPETVMRTQTWSMDLPTVTVRQDCRAGIDTVQLDNKTCHNDFPSFDYPCPEMRTVRGPDICVPVIVAGSRREQIKLDVPEVTMRRQDFIIGVPGFTMKVQKFSFDHPVFIVKDVKAMAAENKKAGDELSRRTTAAAMSISTAMQVEMRTELKAPVEAAFDCQSAEIRSKFREALGKFDGIAAATASGFEKAKELKQSEAIKAYETAVNGLKISREKMLSDYRETEKSILASRRKALADL